MMGCTCEDLKKKQEDRKSELAAKMRVPVMTDGEQWLTAREPMQYAAVYISTHYLFHMF